MSDGAQYQIEVLASATGAETTDAQIHGIADALDAVSAVATPFTGALAAAEQKLAAARTAAADAASALQNAEARFSGLEREATKAGKAVERSQNAAAKLDMLQAKANEAAAAVQALAEAGSDPGALEAAVKRKSSAMAQLSKATKLAGNMDKLKAEAAAAAAAVQAEASVVDAARQKADAAAQAEQRLAASYRSIKTAANQAASAQQRAAAATTENKAKALQLLSQTSPMLGRFAELAKGLGGYALVGLAAAAAVVVLIGAVVGLVAATGAAIVGMVKFAIASDKVAKTRLDKIMKSARESFKGLFEGVKTGPLLNAVERLSKLFDKNTATGAALKKLIETLLNPLLGGSEKLAPLLAEMFKGAVYGALQLAIVVAKARIALYKMIPKEVRTAIKDLIGGSDGLAASFKAGEIIFYAIAAVLGAIAAAALVIGVAIAVAVAATAAFVAGFVALSAAGKAIGNAIVGWTSALAGWVSSAASAAANFVKSLVDGITNGAGAVAKAVGNLAKSAASALFSGLQIGSPSKIAVDAAANVTTSFADTMAAGESSARSAAETMVSPVDRALKSSGDKMPSISNTSTTSNTSGGNVSVSLGGVTFNIQGNDADDIADKCKAAVQDVLDGMAMQLGAGGAAA